MRTSPVIFLSLLFIFTVCTDEKNTIIPTESANERFAESMQWNAQHPYREIILTMDDYTILSIADCHVGSTKNLDQLFIVAKNTNSSAIVLVGDLTTGDSQDYEEFVKHLPPKDTLPLFFIAGNHDEFYSGWKEFYNRFGSSTYYFSVKTPHATDYFICLETGGATLGDDQLQWLEENLKSKREDYRHCFIFTHNNLLRAHHTLSTTPLAEEVVTLVQLFTKYHVGIVITGHDHLQDDRLFGITRYIQLDAFSDENRNAGYLRLNINNGMISYSFENI
ncbi:MAG TPA: metallophosphoesterase [Prolixibacteraceae bacterium]|nr:metallophosphoesterase [Prolixibacteraceae bacterium]